MKSNMLLLMVICFSFPLASFATEVLYVDTDAYGTPVVMTNALGNKVWEGQHMPFGERYQDTASPEENNIGFIGKERDIETELSYFDARYYDDTMGRFTTVDPIGPVDPWSSTTDYAYLAEPQRLSRYSYGLNNPYRYIDPDGQTNIEVTVDRKNENSNRTLGEMTVSNSTTNETLSLKTLELPDRNNKKNSSRVNSGAYNAKRDHSQKFGDVLRLDDANNRTDVLIHPGNTAKDTQGCILPGTGQTNNSVTNSRKAQQSLIDYVDKISEFDKANLQPTNITVIINNP